ncbi:MAG: hypothetical protein CSA94_01395 [Bacteroidetes bacterium]|nr:MAG: hypothetical protein CSA94_01395 [Bacteroidota bacterium]
MFACSKEENNPVAPPEPQPEPQEGIATIGKIEVPKGIKAGSLTVNNGFNSSKINDDGTFDIKTQKNITSVTNENGDVVYIYNKWLAESNQRVKTKGDNTEKIAPDSRETAKSIAFYNLGFAAISVDRDFTNKIGYLMETDPTIKPHIDKLEKVVESDIAKNGALTVVTLTSNALELLNNSVKGALAIPKVVINAHDKLRNIVEYGYDNEYDVTKNTPYFLVQHKMKNGTEDYYEKVDKFGSLKGNCVIKIRRAELQQDKSWRVKFDFYNKSPAYKYATEAKKENEENIYAKNVIKNVIYPYNSIGLLKDISSLSGISKLFKNYKDILENGILETEKYSTVSSKKSKVELDISEEKSYFYLGNARENNLLFAYAVVDIIANLSSATNDFVKAKLELIKAEKGESKIRTN